MQSDPPRVDACVDCRSATSLAEALAGLEVVGVELERLAPGRLRSREVACLLPGVAEEDAEHRAPGAPADRALDEGIACWGLRWRYTSARPTIA